MITEKDRKKIRDTFNFQGTILALESEALKLAIISCFTYSTAHYGKLLKDIKKIRNKIKLYKKYPERVFFDQKELKVLKFDQLNGKHKTGRAGNQKTG